MEKIEKLLWNILEELPWAAGGVMAGATLCSWYYGHPGRFPAVLYQNLSYAVLVVIGLRLMAGPVGRVSRALAMLACNVCRWPLVVFHYLNYQSRLSRDDQDLAAAIIGQWMDDHAASQLVCIVAKYQAGPA